MNEKLSMKSDVALRVLHQDDKILVVQTLSYNSIDDNSYESSDECTKLSEHMLLENTASFGQCNLGLHVKDNPSKVLVNRCRLLAQLNQLSKSLINENDNIKQIHWLNQIHGSEVLDVDELLDLDEVLIESKTAPKHQQIQPSDADALTTTHQGQALAIMTADCIPIVLYCPDSGRIAGVHAGWHGLAKGVIATTVRKFSKSASSNTHSGTETPKKIQAWIGACISVDNYEVSQSVLEELIVASLAHFPMLSTSISDTSMLKEPLDKDSLREQISIPHGNPDKVWLDLPSLAKKQLESMGVQVMSDDIPCSYAHPQYYSHRRATHKQQSSTGRMAMLVVKL